MIIIETTNMLNERIWIVSKTANWRANKDNVVFKKKKYAQLYCNYETDIGGAK